MGVRLSHPVRSLHHVKPAPTMGPTPSIVVTVATIQKKRTAASSLSPKVPSPKNDTANNNTELLTGWEDYESVMDQDLALNVKDDDRRSELYDSNTSLDAMITAIMSSDECATTRLGGHTTDCESPASRLTGVDVALDNSGPLVYGGRSKNDGRMDYLGFVDHTYNTAFLEQEQTTLFNDPILSAPSRMDGGYTGDIDDGDSRVGDDDDDNFFF